MELRNRDEVRHAAAALTSGSGEALDRLVWTGVFAPAELRDLARAAVYDQARSRGVYPASIHGLYVARGAGHAPSNFTVPAINIRGLAYETARALFRARRARDAGAVICEIARSEISYTDQRPSEYAFVVLSAALREGWTGPVFLQGDHFQVNARKYAADAGAELEAVRDLTAEALRAGFYNIDVDSSTLVDLTKNGHEAQQELNGRICADLTTFIRDHEPAGVTVSVGGEIGEVGSKNSTPEELHAFMHVYRAALERSRPGAAGLSKISIQTGTSHGGVPLPDGSIADVKIDFDAIEVLSRLARERYGMAGAVQHGASTLPAELFDRFPRLGACEIHLATEFQNMLFDSPAFPPTLKHEIYEKLRVSEASDRKPSDTDEQFFYKTRKKALGGWKRELWGLPAETRAAIGQALEKKFSFLIDQLEVSGTRTLAEQHAPFVPGSFPAAQGAVAATAGPEDVSGLSD
ncbi:MAG TPA: class II fructose-bisphosphate aldolase [Candidatus Udaeobacter sp.]|jgi:fructose/tagatose bisphosphate aldolase|nr:class II fructose-bisphosphate aldolase [Candidatus Udaeobacter sp.]